MIRTTVFTLFLALAISAGAEIRLINLTGEEFKVDVLHKSGPVRDVSVSAEKYAVSEPIGPVNPRHTSEVLVLKSADGTELSRQNVQSGEILTLVKKPTGYWAGHAAWFPAPAKHATLSVINVTGQQLHYQFETPEFRVRKGKLEYGYGRAWSISNGNDFKIGDKVKVMLGINSAPNKAETFTAGSVYLVTLEGREPTVKEIGWD